MELPNIPRAWKRVLSLMLCAAVLFYTAGLLSKSSTPIDLVQKSQSSPSITSAKEQTGNICYLYDGKCKNLNSNEALADACGPGNTVVGWDDAGCGNNYYHHGKPICCPTDGAPRSCHWRNDKAGGVGGDCISGCHEEETNLAGISSPWGGGFRNDGSTDKCGKGNKSFCCVAPDYTAINCPLASCGKIGQTELDSERATCTADICELIPGYCDSVDGESAEFSEHDESNELDNILYKRGGRKGFNIPDGGPKNMVVTALSYPGPSQLQRKGLLQAIPLAFRVANLYCVGPALNAIKIANPNSFDLKKLETEHVLDRQVIANSFVYSMFTGKLPTKKPAQLPTIKQSFFDQWSVPNTALKDLPGIDSDLKLKLETINDRIMACLGTDRFLKPFSLLERQVNVAKGHLFKGNHPVALTKITGLVNDFIKADTRKAADDLLSVHKSGFAVFEYLRNPLVTAAWAAVNYEMRTQLLNIERVTLTPNLVNWWDVWIADFSDSITREGQQWAFSALQESLTVIQQADQAAVAAGEPTLQHSAMVIAQLGAFAMDIKNMLAPTLPKIPLLPAPGGSRRDLGSSEHSSIEDDQDSSPVEIEERVWGRSMGEADMQHGEDAAPDVHRPGHSHGHDREHDFGHHH